MRKIGGHVSIAGGLINAINNTQQIGGNCLQIFAGSPRLWNRKLFPVSEVDSFNKQIKQFSLDPVFIHALYLVNLASDKPELIKKSVASLIMDTKNGDLINSAGVVIHIGSHQGRGFASAKRQVATLLQEVLDQTKNTNLILENDAGQNGKIGSFTELSELVREINHPRIGICLDTAHTFAGGIDFREQSTLKKMVQDLKSLKLLDKIKLIHLNDSRSTCGSNRDLHANLGQGEIGTEGLKEFINYPELKHLPLILEVPGDHNTGPDAINITRATNLAR